jgi:hypothetical protein
MNIKKAAFIFVLFILSIGLSGCRSEAPSQSSFKDNFTIGTIVEDNAQYLIPGDRALSGSEYGTADEPFTQKQEEIVLQINPADLSPFVSAIRFDIEESIINSGASIVGHGSGGLTGTSFSIQYRENQTYGVINVWGVHGEGTDFFLIVMITES